MHRPLGLDKGEEIFEREEQISEEIDEGYVSCEAFKIHFDDDQTCILPADSRPEDLTLDASSIEILKAPHVTSSFITERVAPSRNITRPERAQIIPSMSSVIYRKKSPCLCSYISNTFVRSPRCCTTMPYCPLSQK